MIKRLLLIGGGGHCHSILDSVLSLNEYDEIGIIDNVDSSYLGISVIGVDGDIPRLFEEGWTEAFISVGSVGNSKIRRRLYNMVKSMGLTVPTIIDPTAEIGKAVIIGEGVFVGKRGIVNTGSKLGTCAIVNSGSIIEHGCIVGDFSHISTGAILCGQVIVGSDTHVGAGSTIRQLVEIGNNTMVGAGSVVVKNIPSDAKAYGNPCKVV